MLLSSSQAEELLQLAAARRTTATTTAERLWGEAAAHEAGEVMHGRHGYLLQYRQLDWNVNEDRTPRHLAAARSLVVGAFNNGLFGNVLQVLDAAVLAEGTAASLSVEWKRQEGHNHFYGEVGHDLWPHLFEPLVPTRKQRHHLTKHGAAPLERVTNRLNPLLLAPSRGLYLAAPFFADHRRAYGATFNRTFRPVKRLMRKIDDITEQPKLAAARARGGRLIGVHCRLASAGAVRAQSTGSMVKCSNSVEAIRAALGPEDVLFIASDAFYDAAAVVAAIGAERCVLRQGVVRVGVGVGTEVHTRPNGASVRDASDVLIDAWVLSRCDVLLYNSESNVVLAVAFLQPALELVALSEAKHEAKAVQPRQHAASLDASPSTAATPRQHAASLDAPPSTVVPPKASPLAASPPATAHYEPTGSGEDRCIIYVQASPSHTGSTVLANALAGLLDDGPCAHVLPCHAWPYTVTTSEPWR